MQARGYNGSLFTCGRGSNTCANFWRIASSCSVSNVSKDSVVILSQIAASTFGVFCFMDRLFLASWGAIIVSKLYGSVILVTIQLRFV